MFFVFVFLYAGALRHLHSFPTRRSSDLQGARGKTPRDPRLALPHQARVLPAPPVEARAEEDRKSTRLNSSHANISYAVFCLKKKNNRLTTAKLSTHTLH